MRRRHEEPSRRTVHESVPAEPRAHVQSFNRGQLADDRLMVGPTPLDAQVLATGTGLRQKKIWLAISVCTSLAMLGFFKYFNFAMENYNFLIHWFGLSHLKLETLIRVTLPLGFDCSRGKRTLEYRHQLRRALDHARRDLRQQVRQAGGGARGLALSRAAPRHPPGIVASGRGRQPDQR